MDKDLKLWEKAVNFHGHVCGGITIGYKAALYAIELLNITFSEDEDLVCVTENDACGVDSIQAILGCSVGKGNLLFRLRGKQAFSFFNRKNGKSVRIVAKDIPMTNNSKEEREKYLFEAEPKDLFDVKDVTFELPEKARIFNSIICDCCKEKTADYFIHIEGDKKLCPDCYKPYDRFF